MTYTFEEYNPRTMIVPSLPFYSIFVTGDWERESCLNLSNISRIPMSLCV